jgi:hypothetical protein
MALIAMKRLAPVRVTVYTGRIPAVGAGYLAVIPDGEEIVYRLFLGRKPLVYSL